MSLPDYIGASLEGPISVIRRHAVAIVVAAFSAAAAVLFGLWALLLAIEPYVGPVYARIVIAAVAALIAVGAIYLPRLFHTESVVERARAEADTMTRDQKIAMVIEAVMGGFALSSRGRKASSGE
jgi:hypothetical protein